MPSTVALDTDAPDIPVGQKEPVGGSVGIMANAASLILDRGMLEDPGTSLFGMALEADIDIEFVPPPQTRPGTGSVGGVAVGAKKRSFKNSVSGRKKKFEPDFPVARQTQIGLFGLEESRQGGHRVHTMAVVAAHGPQLVGSSLELEKFLLLLVALEASVRSNLGSLILECKNRILVSSGIDVFFSGSVAGLAALSIRGGSGVEVSHLMGIFFAKGLVEVSMANLAGSGHESLHIPSR